MTQLDRTSRFQAITRYKIHGRKGMELDCEWAPCRTFVASIDYDELLAEFNALDEQDTVQSRLVNKLQGDYDALRRQYDALRASIDYASNAM